MPTKANTLTGGVIAVTLAAALGWVALQPTEPTWEGRPLSEWLQAYDNYGGCIIQESGPKLPFTYEEADEALKEMTPLALPVLLKWLTTKPSGIKLQANKLLNKQPWIELRFDDRDYRSLAVTGFMAYHTNAQPLLPDLLELSHSPNPHTRMLAYEAAFFTRPDKEIFLPLATRALNEEEQLVQAMAAHWMMKRFPDEAETRISWADILNSRK